MDLGTQQIYSKKKSIAVFKKRAVKAVKKLNMIKKARVPRAFKKTMCINAGLSTALYGTMLQQPSKSDIHAIRVATAKAMQRTGAGSNAYLACNAKDANLDPEFRLFITRFLAWRRLFKSFPKVACDAHKLMHKIQERESKIPGPMHAFVAMLCKLGGRILPCANFIQLDGITFDWTKVSPKTVRRILSQAWIKHVATCCIDRKHFDIHDFDVQGARQASKKLSHRDQTFHDAHMCGRHYTNDIMSKYIPTVEDVCPFCDMPGDTRRHRIFQCKKLACIRDKYPLLKGIKSTWKETFWYFGLCPPLPDVSRFRIQIDSMDWPFVIPVQDGKTHHIFTDGTAFFSNFPTLCLAAGAFIEFELHSTVPICIRRAIAPGIEHNSFIGEMYAILMTLNAYHDVRIFTDCQAVVDLINDAVEGIPQGRCLCHQHQGLWDCIVAHIKSRPSNSIKISKTKAHSDVKLLSDPQLIWEAKCNSLVDWQAKQAIFAG